MENMQGTLEPSTKLTDRPNHSTGWAAHFLNDNHHARAYQAYSTYRPYLTRFLSLLDTARGYIEPLIDQISTKPDLATIALLLVIILVSLKILDMLWQTLTFWLRLVRRTLFWGMLVSLGFWVYARGVEGVVEDVGLWKERWWEEYEIWQERERIARMMGQGQRGFGGRHRGGW
ncbi:Nuclear pore assembly and biogenesis [Teratosphaeria destructans]|uniref:Nuclear pore assembly and biogenesis n=1 Tax=Teratosphaeria destructans TaxID=418781 RepID=A0A9W7W288_9PEZI|nr:Nuclear pore assembly and biogenesis [Teratosphaeria destructans]